MFMFLRIERPTTATFRPLAIATSAACCTRWMFDANDATMIRPVRRGISWRNASPTSRSEPVIPGRSALVESPSRRSMPRLPSSASAPTSVFRPSTGVWSSFQSPVWSTRPADVSITTAIESGIEWAIRTNSSRNGPSTIAAPPGSASVSSVTDPRPCSSSFDLTSPSVRRVPITSPTSTSRSTYGRPPTWSSCAWVSTTARTGFPRRYENSGRSRSTPRCSSRGNASPASTTMRSSPSSKTVMFLPISPSPPSGMIRSVSATVRSLRTELDGETADGGVRPQVRRPGRAARGSRGSATSPPRRPPPAGAAAHRPRDRGAGVPA